MSKVCEHLKEVGCIKDICTCNTGPKQEMVEESAIENRIRGINVDTGFRIERNYSLEEISKDFVGEGKSGGYFDDFLDYRINNPKIQITFKEWFEQHKKK